ncbi:6920_t:CDS:2 [Acaulospora morrowiae]|uniref:6920_t:CDS:1 n=1 Tax=Acaulospora morrowiae TaxID=94023 RepID=A0A9N8VHI9_9GLOM|nr:6920_t:CDS:2 [Acaulospora morrowiae]
MSPFLAVYDVAAIYIKYNEGFLMIPYNGMIITKPSQFWSAENQRLVIYFNYILCINFSIQTCLLFLLQCFWNYLANNIAKTTFMGSLEFKSYIAYSIFSAILFPVLQWIFRDDDFYTEIVPQLAFGIIMLIIGLLGIRSHWRFTRLLKKTSKSSASKIHIITKLEYFKEMNQYLSCGLFVGSTSLITLCIDGFTPTRFLNTHKFYTDFLICHVNFTLWIVYVTLILIFYPSSGTAGELASKGVASSVTSKSAKNNFLEPRSKRWSKYIPVTEISPWSSHISTQNSRNESLSWCVDVQEDKGRSVNSTKNCESIPLDVFTPPLTPPSPYRPHSTHGVEGPSSPSFYFSSDTLLPNPNFLTFTSSQSSSLKVGK